MRSHDHAREGFKGEGACVCGIKLKFLPFGSFSCLLLFDKKEAGPRREEKFAAEDDCREIAAGLRPSQWQLLYGGVSLRWPGSGRPTEVSGRIACRISPQSRLRHASPLWRGHKSRAATLGRPYRDIPKCLHRAALLSTPIRFFFIMFSLPRRAGHCGSGP